MISIDDLILHAGRALALASGNLQSEKGAASAREFSIIQLKELSAAPDPDAPPLRTAIYILLASIVRSGEAPAAMRPCWFACIATQKYLVRELAGHVGQARIAEVQAQRKPEPVFPWIKA